MNITDKMTGRELVTAYLFERERQRVLADENDNIFYESLPANGLCRFIGLYFDVDLDVEEIRSAELMEDVYASIGAHLPKDKVRLYYKLMKFYYLAAINMSTLQEEQQKAYLKACQTIAGQVNTLMNVILYDETDEDFDENPDTEE